MTKRKNNDTSDAAAEAQCPVENADGVRCLYVVHDDSVEHAFTAEEAAPEGTTGETTPPDATPEPTETAAEPTGGPDGPSAPESPAETPRSAAPARETVNAWWCGVCDNASQLNVGVCPKCGTARA